jgi:hypothetical protein
VSAPHIVRPLRYLRDRLAIVGPKGEVSYPPLYHAVRRAAKAGNGQYVQDAARWLYAHR